MLEEGDLCLCVLQQCVGQEGMEGVVQAVLLICLSTLLLSLCWTGMVMGLGYSSFRPDK